MCLNDSVDVHDVCVCTCVFKGTQELQKTAVPVNGWNFSFPSLCTDKQERSALLTESRPNQPYLF